MHESECKSCGAAIIWVESPAGKTMPVNAQAVVGYALIEDAEQPGMKPRLSKLSMMHISHFVTCPAAFAYREAKRMTQGGQ